MRIEIRPSDLFYKYARKKASRNLPKFTGKPDATPFDRDDLYEVIPLLEAVMAELGTQDGTILEKLEEIMIFHMPKFIESREQVFDFLVGSIADRQG
ncbi:MAG: hypothetical protein JXQ81_07930 [Desulfuromonadales bacterium]|nr:hypothetical protein [Desulfuromonadales bacterium]MBN2792417.1 hypothetical protein [Desulfuromonadales bacterium]